VTADDGSARRYRLLETTRAYAWQKLTESGEDQKIARRHCEQLIDAMEKFGAEIWARPNPASINFFVLNLSNLRAALEWCFTNHGDNALGTRLTGASASSFFQAGLLPECVAWTERAIGVLDTPSKGTRLELELLACFSQSLFFQGISTDDRLDPQRLSPQLPLSRIRPSPPPLPTVQLAP
jgi:hypothetical protein